MDVLDRLLLRAPAQVTDPDRVARVHFGSGNGELGDLTDYPTFEALSASTTPLARCAVYFSESLTPGRGERARRLEVVDQSPGYFAVLGVQPAIGSFPDAANASREDVAVISHALWQRESAAPQTCWDSRSSVGLDTYTIVAVAPRGFAGVGFKAGDVWLPLAPRGRANYGSQWNSIRTTFA